MHTHIVMHVWQLDKRVELPSMCTNVLLVVAEHQNWGANRA